MSNSPLPMRALALAVAIGFAILLSAGCGGSGDTTALSPTSPAPTVSLKLVRLDNQALDLSAKPIPLSVSVKATFSEAMDAPSVEGAVSLLDASGNAVAGAFSWNTEGTEATFTPARKLLPRTTYTIHISDTATSAAKAAMAAVDQQFLTMTAGDIDGDGVPDIVVSATGLKGSVYVYSGASLATNPITPMATILGEINGGGFGQQVAMAGDADADGYADVVVGMPSYDPTGVHNMGAAYFFSGKNLFGAAPVVKKASDADATLFGRETQNFQFGISLAGGFDVDGDKYDDILISEQADPTHQGAVYVFSGKTLSGTKKAADATYVMTGASGEIFGIAVAGLRDIDGDGKDDILVGAIDAAPPGAAYLFRASDLSASTPVANAAAVYRTAVVGVMFFANLLSGTGDIDGDGIDDLMITDVQDAGGKPSLYVFSGKDVPATGTVHLDNTKTVTTFNNIPGGVANPIAFSSVGDIDDDGRDDIIIGTPWADLPAIIRNGRAWVYGLDAGNAQTMLADVTVTGAAQYYFGWSVSGIGDIDGDKTPDIAVTAYSDQGYVHIFSGAALTSGPKYTITGSVAGEKLGQSVSGAWR